MHVHAEVVYANIAQIMWIAWISALEKRILDVLIVMIAEIILAKERIIGNLLATNTKSQINMRNV